MVERVQVNIKNSWWQWVIPPAVLAVICYFFYRPSIDYPFQFDDIANITKFFHIRNETFSSLFFCSPRWISTWLSAVNYRMGTADPFAPHYYRLCNIGIHIVTASLVYWFTYLALRQLKSQHPRSRTASSWWFEHAFAIATVTAALFFLHPVQSQTVSYVIQGRLEGLAGMCIMLLMVLVLLIGTTRNLAARVFFAMGVAIMCLILPGTKEMAIVSPVLALLVDWFFVAQGSWQSLKSRWWLHAMIFTLILGGFLYFLKPQFFSEILLFKKVLHNNIGNEITENRLDPIKPMGYFISQFKVILHYLWIFLWPFGISVDYDWKLSRGFFEADCLLPFLLLVGIGIGIVRLLRKNNVHMAAFGPLWFFITIAPRASIIPSTEIMADYKTYLASYGWLFVLASLSVYTFYALLERWNKAQNERMVRFGGAATICAATFLLGFATYTRNQVWHSAEEFWANIISNAPGRARAYNNYGVALSEAGKHAEAIPHFKKAIKMDSVYPDPLNNLAVAYSAVGNLDEAIDILKRGLQIQGAYPEAYNNLASFLIQKQDFASAEQMLNISLQLRPWYGKAFFNFGRLYGERARLATNEKERAQFQERSWQGFRDACVRGDFDNNLVGINEWARASMNLKKYDDAIMAYNRILVLHPHLHEALFFIGNAHFFKKDIPHAIEAYAAYAQRAPQDMRGWNNLGEVLFMQKNYAQARAAFERTVQLEPKALNPRLRLAECYSNLKQPREAQAILQAVVGAQGIPDNIRANIQVALSQLQRQINGSRVG